MRVFRNLAVSADWRQIKLHREDCAGAKNTFLAQNIKHKKSFHRARSRVDIQNFPTPSKLLFSLDGLFNFVVSK